jgi:hypothetical protein
MYTVNKKQVDWTKDWQNWNNDCPVCEGTGMVTDPEHTWETAEVAERFEACDEIGISVFAARRNEAPTDLSNIDISDMGYYFSVLQETDCEECAGTGHMELIWSTVWEIGKSVSDQEMREVCIETGCIVVTDSDGEPWLTLGGRGMDMTPHLCHAWLVMGFQWLPLEWISNLVGNGSYVESCKDKKTARWIREIIDSTLNSAEVEIESLRTRNAKYLRG